MWTLSFFPVLLGLQLFLGTTATPIDKPDYNNPRIVNGSDATIEQYPFTVSIQWFRYHLCGGVIISPDYVLTSARCIEKFPPAELRILAGSTERNNYDAPAKEVSFEKAIVHDEYNSVTWAYDIAILVLTDPLDLTGDNMKSIRFYEGTNPSEINFHVDLTVIGWGNLEEGASFYPINLHAKGMSFGSIDHCAEVLGDFDRLVDPLSMFCAYGFDTESEMGVSGGICEGDWGGPLITTPKKGSPHAFLVGLASWGFTCNNNYPQIFTNVQRARLFIEKNTGLWGGNIPKLSLIK